MLLFGSQTPKLAINIKEAKIEHVQDGYFAGKTLWLRNLKYDPGKFT